MAWDYLVIAVNNIRHRRLRSWLTMIGIFIGIAAVISLIGLGEGLRIAITSQFGFLGTDVLSVQASGIMYGPPGTGVVEPLDDDLADIIEKTKGVKSAFNRYIETTTIEFNERQIIGYAVNLPGGEDRKTVERMFNFKAVAGRIPKDGERRKIFLGNRFVDKNIFGKNLEPGNTVLVNGIGFEVVGILEKKGNFMIDNAVYINEDDLLDLFDNKGTTDVIAVIVRDEKEIDNVKEDIEKLLRKERNVKVGEENFQVTSPQAMLDSLSSTLFAVNLFVVIIASISLVVGGIGIMNTMYTSVLERTREIGIMKSIGAKNSTIFTLFFIESGFLGMAGGIIGIILGLSLAYGMAYIGRLALGSDLIQAHVSGTWIMISIIFSFGLGTLFGVLPALRASKLHPVDALRSK